MAVVTSVMRVQQLLLRQVEEVLRPLGLTFARYEVLMLLGFSRTGALPVGKVGERLQVHPASVTNAVDRLERDGFVERVANPRDGRSVLASITPAGRERGGSGLERPQPGGLHRGAADRRRAGLALRHPQAAPPGLRRLRLTPLALPLTSK